MTPQLVFFFTIILYMVIATAYGQFFYLRFKDHPEYLNLIPPAFLIGAFWPVSIPAHFAMWLGGFIHAKATGKK